MRTWLLGLVLVLLPVALPGAILVSARHSGTGSAAGESELTHLTADGRFLVFTSGAPDVVVVDTNAKRDVFLRDLKRGTVRLASVNMQGTDSGNGQSFSGVVSGDGRYVAFAGSASDLTANDTNGATTDVFRRDMLTGATVLVSANTAGTGSGNGQSFAPLMTPDGRFILFSSFATDLTTVTDGNNDSDLFVRDMQTGTTRMVSRNSTGTAAGSGGTPPFESAISDDGRYVAFTSYASNLVSNDTNGTNPDVFQRDMQNDSTVLVSRNASGTGSGSGNSIAPSMTPDGRYVAFDSNATDLTVIATSGFKVFRRDMQTGATALVSTNSAGNAGVSGDAFKDPGCMTDDGRYVLFRTTAPDAVATTDGNGTDDIFVRDLQGNSTALVSINAAGTATGNDASFTGAIAAGGGFVAFASRATNLEGVNANGTSDIFIRDLQAGTTLLASSNELGSNGGGADSASSLPILVGADGRLVAWESSASDLAPSDANNNDDVFAFGALRPFALAADTGGNGVLEPGETAVVEPAWRNDTGVALDASGTATGLTGPAGPTYTLNDDQAGYGTIALKQAASCGATTDCYQATVTGNRPGTHWDATLAESLDTGHAASWALHLGDSFADVPRSNFFYGFIEALLHHGVTGGCAAGQYCPAGVLSRDQMAVFVLRAKERTPYSAAACGSDPFNDVPAASPFCPWIAELFRRGVVAGCGSNNYCPSSPVTREQVAVFLLRTKEGAAFQPAACVGGSETFQDVPVASPFCPWVQELAARGVTSGCGGGNYCPTSPVTREQVAVFLVRMFGLTLYGPS
jgi:Tol biopolymer transport system component